MFKSIVSDEKCQILFNRDKIYVHNKDLFLVSSLLNISEPRFIILFPRFLSRACIAFIGIAKEHIYETYEEY